MPHPILSRLSALQFGWLTFWAFAIGLALASERISDTENMLVIGGVFIAAGLAAVAAYLAISGALARRGRRVNWSAFLLASLANVALAAVMVESFSLDDGAGARPPDGVGAPPTETPPAPAIVLPEFPWPPPRASAQAVLNIGGPPGTLGLLDRDLSIVLENSGYDERSYFAVPGGFALVTRLEQTEADGRPKDGDERWAITVGPLQEFSLSAYLKALFTANPGYYRVLAFIISATPFAQSETTVGRDEAMRWLTRGLNVLPATLAEQPLTAEHRATVLVYEFEQRRSASDRPRVTVPGRLTARAHLERSSLWKELGQ